MCACTYICVYTRTYMHVHPFMCKLVHTVMLFSFLFFLCFSCVSVCRSVWLCVFFVCMYTHVHMNVHLLYTRTDMFFLSKETSIFYKYFVGIDKIFIPRKSKKKITSQNSEVQRKNKNKRNLTL